MQLFVVSCMFFTYCLKFFWVVVVIKGRGPGSGEQKMTIVLLCCFMLIPPGVPGAGSEKVLKDPGSEAWVCTQALEVLEEILEVGLGYVSRGWRSWR